jgi:aspartate aminotransferase
MASVASETFTSTSAPIQYAAIRAFEGGDEIEHYLTGCRRVLKALAKDLTQILAGSGIAVTEPRGAFYLFPDFSPLAGLLAERDIRTSDQLCERLLEETGVAMLPGTGFGRAPGELVARLAYVNFSGGAALDELDRRGSGAEVDEGFLRRCCGETIEAVQRIAAWIAA